MTDLLQKIQSYKETEESPLDASLDVASQFSPDDMALARKWATDENADILFNVENINDLRRHDKIKRVSDTLQKYKELGLWVEEDVVNAAEAMDDIGALGKIERWAKLGGTATLAAGQGIGKGTYGVLELASAGVGFEKGQEFFKGLRGEVQAYQDYLKNKAAPQGIMQEGVYSGIQSLGDQLPATLLAVMTRNPSISLASAALSVGGDSAGEALDKGLTPTQSAIYAGGQASIEVLTEMLPITRLIGDTKAGAPFIKKLINQAITEVPGELVATTLQNFNEWAMLRPNAPFSDYVKTLPEDLATTFVATIVSTGLQTGAVHGSGKLIDRLKAQDYEQEKLTELETISKEVGLKERNPAGFEEVVNRMANGSGLESLYVDSEAVNTLYQSNREVFEESFPEIVDQLDEAVASGSDMQLTAGQAARLLGNDITAPLKADMRFAPAMPEDFAPVERFEDNAVEIYDDVYEQLSNAGVPHRQAQAAATATKARYEALGEAEGRNAEEIYLEQGLQIQRQRNETPEELRKYEEGLTDVEKQQLPAAMNLWRSLGKKQVNRNNRIEVARVLGLPSAPRTLAQDIKEIGGLSTALTSQERGNVRAAGKSAKEALLSEFKDAPEIKRLVKLQGGRGLDDAARELQAKGWFPDVQGEAQPQDLIDLINSNGINSYPPLVEAELQAIEERESGFDRELQQLGLSEKSTPQEIAKALAGEQTLFQKVRGLFQGKPKDVTETKAFKEWFGNSKVVDADGKPLVVYHGTRSVFEAFDLNKSGKNGQAVGKGFYFTDSKGLAEGYGDVGEFYLLAENPTFSIKEKTITLAQVKKILIALEKHDEYLLSNYGDIESEGRAPVLKRALEDVYTTSKDDADIIASFINIGGVERDIVMDTIIKITGKDGFVTGADIAAMGVETNDKIYVVLSPTQIKSVNNRGTFDPNDARILYQNNRGMIQAYNGKSIITLFEGADASTVMHELSHQWIFELSRYGRNNPRLQKDLDILLEFTGTKTYEEFDASVDAQEQVARAFEAYLMEGKSPSIELQSAFERFAAWLTRIYKSIKGLDVTLNDDVRGVFDRMLATEEQIANKRAVSRMEADPAIMEILTETEKQSYLRNIEKAKTSQKQKLRKKLIKEITREKRKWWEAERQEVVDQLTKESRRENVYMLADYLRDGKMLDENFNPVEMETLRMDKKLLRDIFSDNQIKEIEQKHKIKLTQKGGQSPHLLAEMFGFNSPESMIYALTDAMPLSNLVQSSADSVMKGRHGDLLNDGSIEEEAIASLLTSEQMDVTMQEMQAITAQTGRQDITTTKAALRHLAKQQVLGKTARQLRAYMKYYNASLKAASESGKALAKKDYEKAASEKRKQLLNQYLFAEHKVASEELEKIVRNAKRYIKPRVRGALRTEYMEKIDALMDGIDFYGRRPKIGRTERILKSVVNLNELMKDADIPADIAERFLRPDGYRYYGDMTMNELRDLHDSLRNLEHLARVKQKIIVNGKARDFNLAVNDVVTEIRSNLKSKPVPINPRREGEQRKEFFRNYLGLITKAQTYVENMDGGKKLGVVYNTFKRNLDEGVTALNQSLNEYGKEYLDILKKHYGTATIKGYPLFMENLKKVNIYIPEVDRTFSKEEILSIALNRGNDQNLQRLMAGRSFASTPEKVDAILDRMNENDWAFVQDVWALINKNWPSIVEREKRRTGIIPTKVEAVPFMTKYGEIAGGYYPIKYESTIDLKDAIVETFDDLRRGMFGRAATKRGHLQERKKNVERPIRIDLGVINQHLTEVLTDLHLGEAVEGAYKLLHNPKVKSAIHETLGTDAFGQLDLWIKDTAAGAAGSSVSHSKILRNLRTSISVGAMGLKFSTTMVQASGFSHSLVEVGAKWMLKGVTRFSASPVETYKAVMEMSPYMLQRSTTMNRDLMDSVKLMQNKPISSFAMKTYFWPIVKMQTMVDIPTFVGAYEKGLAKGMSEKDAIRFAEQSVENAQGTGNVVGLSSFERGTLSPENRMGEGIKLWSTFYSYFNTKLNLAMRRTQETNFRNPVQVAGLAADYLTLFIGEALITEAIMGRLPDDDEEDETEWLPYLSKLGLMNVAATLPFIREVSSGFQGFDAVPGGARGLGEFVRGARGVKSVVEDYIEGEDIDVAKGIKSAVTVANVISPVKLPSGQIGVVVDALDRSAEGEDVQMIDYFIRPQK